MLCHRCGDQVEDNLCWEGPLTRSDSPGRTRPIVKELLLRSASLARVRGRKTFSEIFSVAVDGRLSERSFDAEVADKGRA